MVSKEVHALISKRIRILALTLVSCFCLLSFAMGQPQSSVSISNSGTISLIRSYVCGNYNSTHYYAQNNVTGNYELISTDATQTISYALSKLTPGRTWQETVLLKGNFLIKATITLSQANAKLDFSQANITLSTAIVAFDVRGNNNAFYGGAYNPFTDTGTHSVWDAGRTESTAIETWNSGTIIDGFEFSGFTSSGGIVVPAYGSKYCIVQNCWFHDSSGAFGIVIVGSGGGGYHQVLYNKIGVTGTGIMGNGGAPHNTIIGNEIYATALSGDHPIYMDDGGLDPSLSGYNEIAFNKFHDYSSGAGCHIKCQFNSIRDNEFYSVSAAAAVGLSIYSEGSSSWANDNEIYNNTFTNMVEGIWLGHNPADNPTLRNKIHDNIFTSVTNCIRLNPWDGAINTVEDTWVYYNNFTSCTNIFPASGNSATLIKNTVIAYNKFSPVVTNLWVESCVNTMVYGNSGMADFNVPSPLPIPPRAP
jgi:hypothetical protein